MNPHLFLDILVRVWAILFTARSIAAAYAWYKGEGDAALGVVIGSFLATLCWAWIVAG